ncbi:hypothetical protein Tco_1490700 [Tanacetum coccineum]
MLERSKKSRSHKLKRLYKVGFTARIESTKEEDLGEDDPKGRINDMMTDDANITLVSPFVDEDDVEMFDKEEDVSLNAIKDGVNENEEVVEEVCAGETKKTVSRFGHTEGEQGIFQRTQTIAQPQDKGKAKMIEPVKHKMKDQVRLDEETALRLQAKFDEEVKLANEEAKNVKKANIAMI